MAKTKHKERILGLLDYIISQRTNLQPVFMGRLKREARELRELLRNE